jgi:hypothetical protein
MPIQAAVRVVRYNIVVSRSQNDYPRSCSSGTTRSLFIEDSLVALPTELLSRIKVNIERVFNLSMTRTGFEPVLPP